MWAYYIFKEMQGFLFFLKDKGQGIDSPVFPNMITYAS